MEIINLAILKNPLNWLTVMLMLIIFAMFADVVLSHHVDLKEALNPHPAANQ